MKHEADEGVYFPVPEDNPEVPNSQRKALRARRRKVGMKRGFLAKGGSARAR